MTFIEMLQEGTPETLYKKRLLRYNLADVCLEHFKLENSSGRDIYSALSHLAMIPELEIDMAYYDNLMFVDNALVSPGVFYFAQSKLIELGELLNKQK